MVRVLEDFTFTTSWGEHVTVPKGTMSDFASVPGPLQWLVPKVGKWSTPSIIHDFLWQGSKVHANAVFFDALLAYQVPLRLAFLIYLAVALNGWRLTLKEHRNK